ncbi:hypothetical protein GJ496_007005 [Pomphorhynchus laevis]|nr:hypothetical protein GJ496_007005 [Pomphorhynchus laevis]
MSSIRSNTGTTTTLQACNDVGNTNIPENIIDKISSKRNNIRKLSSSKSNRNIYVNEPSVIQSKECLKLLKHTENGYEKDQWDLLRSIFKEFDKQNEIYNYVENDLKECMAEIRTEDDCIQFLKRRCAVCYQLFARCSIITMVVCHCEICAKCFQSGYTLRSKESNLDSMWPFTCLICMKPKNILEEPIHTEILLNLLQQHTSSNLARKYSNGLADISFRTMNGYTKCRNCNNEFIAAQSSQLNKMQSIVCTNCNRDICINCGQLWASISHQSVNGKIICSSNVVRKAANSEHRPFETISCPKCKACFELARGGCLHLQCSFCHHEFCQSCLMPMYRDPSQCSECVKLQKVGKRGYSSLHAHHPRNCLYYLRDLSPQQLIGLLKDNHINWHDHKHGLENELRLSSDRYNGLKFVNNRNVCQMLVQRDDANSIDSICAADSCLIDQRICEMHLKEFIVKLIKSKKIDPVNAYEVNDLKQIIARSSLQITTTSNQRHHLIEMICKHLPINDDVF